MTLERALKLPDNMTISDASLIDKLLSARRELLEHRKRTSPAQVLSGIDLETAELVLEERPLVGVLEINAGEENSLSNPLYEIPDIAVDLTPEEEFDPRKTVRFRLTSQGKQITIDAKYHARASEYIEHDGDEKTVGKLLEKDLRQVLQERNWQYNELNGWSVAV